MLFGVEGLALDEGGGVLTPVSQRVQVVGCVVSVVEAVAIALVRVVSLRSICRGSEGRNLQEHQ